MALFRPKLLILGDFGLKKPIKTLTGLEELMLQKMCLKSAKGVKVQCSKEYWEDANEADPRATQLHLLQPDKHKHLPTNNLVTET